MERGNYCTRTYLSFMQYKSSELVCRPDVNFFLVDLTPELVLKTPNSSTQGRLRWIGNKPLESQVFMLDAWKVCSYTIIPFYLPRILVNNEEIYNDAGGEVESLYALKLSQPLNCLLTIFYPGLQVWSVVLNHSLYWIYTRPFINLPLCSERFQF